jgi:23S rRNA (uracil1939-C5)-methyltransferase
MREQSKPRQGSHLTGYIDPSAPHCPHRPPCPGCPRFGEAGIARLARDALDELARAHGLAKVDIVSGESLGFRHRARLAIRGRLGSPKLGLFELGTHRVAHIPSCVVHHPLINRVANVVRRALVETRVTCYSDAAHLGVARYLQVVIERSSQTAQVVMVANSAAAEPLAECLNLIRERLGKDLHSLWFNANLDRANTILGAEFRNWCGPATVVEHFGGAAVCYTPGAFGQNNLNLAEILIGHVRRQIPAASSVAEFYAGVGAIGLSVLDRAAEMRLNEVGASSLQGLALGIARLDPEDQARISVTPGEAGKCLAMAAGAQVIIADPPRKGLDAQLADYLSENPPERFIYVSCGLESFIQDTVRLVSRGKLRLSALTAFNLLPFTHHVELVAQFERR